MSGDLMSLSNRPRHENMHLLRPLGSWESGRLDNKNGGIPRQTNITREKTAMAPVKGTAECSLCGLKKNLRTLKGLALCAVCLSITSSAANHPQLVLKAVHACHPELLGLHPPEEAGPAAGGDRTALNTELAAANTSLVQKMRMMEEQENTLRQDIDMLKDKLQASNNHNNQLADDNLTLAGELEGLQDVLSTLEGERTAWLQEQSRLTDEVRWLYQRLGAYEKAADSLESEIDRLQEGAGADISPAACCAAFETTALARKPCIAAAVDPVNQPRHYTSHPSGIECIQITEHMGFTLGNAVKYIWRADLKEDAIQDLHKAQWYIARELKKRGTVVEAS